MKTLAAAPVHTDTESQRAFLQRRVLFLATLFGCITIGLHVFIRLLRLSAPHEIDSLMGTRLVSLQLVMLAAMAAMWLRLRQGSRSLSELRAIDALLAVSPALVAMQAFAELSPHLRPELLLLLLVAHVTMARAVIVPSTATRTLVLSALGFLSVDIWTYVFYARHADPTLPASYIYVAPVFAWTCASTAVSTITSYTIFGLRKKVVEVCADAGGRSQGARASGVVSA